MSMIIIGVRPNAYMLKQKLSPEKWFNFLVKVYDEEEAPVRPDLAGDDPVCTRGIHRLLINTFIGI